jgi:hypothetical protein
MSAEYDYQFEMFDLRKDVLALVAMHVRDGDFVLAKHAAKREILRRAEGDASKAADAFGTSFDKAKEMVQEGGNHAIHIDAMPSILPDHDAEINPNTEIDGDVVEVVTSVDTSSFRESKSVYPVVDHPSGFRVCTCGAQKYYITCPHTLARVIEMNWSEAPVLD